jgi:hypothetical protein
MGRAASPSIGITNLGRRVTRLVEVAITTTVAWAFGLATAVALVYLAMHLYTGKMMFASPMVLLDPSDASHPWALSFSGMSGSYAAVGMAAGVMVLLAMSMMFNSLLRQLGLLGLVFWSGVWALAALEIVKAGWTANGWTGDKRMLLVAGGLLVVFACSVHRTWRVWRVRVNV